MIISSRIKLSCLFGTMVRNYRLFSAKRIDQERNCERAHRIRLYGECTHEYHCVLPHYTRSRGSVQSADQNYLSATEDDIKIYDASKLIAVFSRTQSCLYQYLWICKVSSLEDILSLRNLLLSKMDSNFLITFLYVPIHGLFFQNLKDTRRCD